LELFEAVFRFFDEDRGVLLVLVGVFVKVRRSLIVGVIAIDVVNTDAFGLDWSRSDLFLILHLRESIS